jgi:hypothetical protein
MTLNQKIYLSTIIARQLQAFANQSTPSDIDTSGPVTSKCNTRLIGKRQPVLLMLDTLNFSLFPLAQLPPN